MSEHIDPPMPPATDRLVLIDAMRGFALAGVLLVNLGGFSLYYFMDDTARAALPSAGFDRWAVSRVATCEAHSREDVARAVAEVLR